MILWNDKRVGLQNVFEATKDENLSIEFWSFNREKLHIANYHRTAESNSLHNSLSFHWKLSKNLLWLSFVQSERFFSYLFEFIVDISGSENLFHTGTLKIIV